MNPKKEDHIIKLLEWIFYLAGSYPGPEAEPKMPEGRTDKLSTAEVEVAGSYRALSEGPDGFRCRRWPEKSGRNGSSTAGPRKTGAGAASPSSEGRRTRWTRR